MAYVRLPNQLQMWNDCFIRRCIWIYIQCTTVCVYLCLHTNIAFARTKFAKTFKFSRLLFFPTERKWQTENERFQCESDRKWMFNDWHRFCVQTRNMVNDKDSVVCIEFTSILNIVIAWMSWEIQWNKQHRSLWKTPLNEMTTFEAFTFFHSIFSLCRLFRLSLFSRCFHVHFHWITFNLQLNFVVSLFFRMSALKCKADNECEREQK